MIGIVLGQDCENTLELSLNSLKECDKLYYVDGGSKDNSINIAKKYCDKVLNFNYDKSDSLIVSKQKNFMIDFLKKEHLSEWAIYLDADEVLEDDGIKKIKESNYMNSDIFECYDIRMRHLMYTLNQEDNIRLVHRVPTRFFKITEKLFFPEHEHCFLQGYKDNNIGFINNITIWHLAFISSMFDVKKRYDGQKLRYTENTSHNKDFLEQWYRAHLFGKYPRKEFNVLDLPKSILNYFSINKDELYFANRNLETKHFIMAKQWIEYFSGTNVIEFGCGKGPFGYVFRYNNIDYTGIELSKFAVDNSFTPIKQGDILTYKSLQQYSLVIAFDILEHLKYEDLDKAIKNLINTSNEYILISVPVIGDPNLKNDPTHIIKETKEWWIKQFTDKKLKLIKTPEHFLFKDQILIFKK